jgi:hypothetical protein
LLLRLFDCSTFEEVQAIGYENALSYITQSVDKLVNGEVQITEKYRSLFPHVAAAIRLNGGTKFINNVKEILYQRKQSYEW